MTQQAFTKIVIPTRPIMKARPKLGGGNGLVPSLAACLVTPGTAR